MKLYVNEKLQTTNCGTVTVLQLLPNDKCVVRFDNTGTLKECRVDAVKAGNVRDPYAKNVCGVACTGNIKTKGKHRALYSVWHDMIGRCYDPKNKRSKAYANVTVDDRWLTFENFWNDCQALKGYDYDKIVNGELVLDKDLLQMYQEHKVYSRDTCQWITKSQNNSIKNSQQKPFYGKSPDGTVYCAYNITQFAREHGLPRNSIAAILHGRGKMTHGWKFSYNEIV